MGSLQYKASYAKPHRVKPSFVNFRHQGTLTLMAERQSAASECPDVKNYK